MAMRYDKEKTIFDGNRIYGVEESFAGPGIFQIL
jgi:hypothetical protein